MSHRVNDEPIQPGVLQRALKHGQATVKRRRHESRLTMMHWNAWTFSMTESKMTCHIWPPLASITIEALAEEGEVPSNIQPPNVQQDLHHGSLTESNKLQASFISGEIPNPPVNEPSPTESGVEEPSRSTIPIIISQGTYETLPFHDSIRVLEIEPGQGDEQIVCHLHLARLNTSGWNVAYEALSYTWGSHLGKFEILLNGMVKDIQLNLFLALRRLRSHERPRFIWADALCIDQSNQAERGHQVRLMSLIYMRAEKVLIWIGENRRSQAELAFSILCSVVNHWKRKPSDRGTATYSVSGRGSVPNVGGPPPEPESEFWNSVSALFECAWFWRLWVVQEVALARSACLIWGDVEISWHWVGLAAALIRTNYYKVLTRLEMGGVYNAYLMYRLSAASQFAYPFPIMSFLQLLRLTRQFESTDPCDRIYGILGLRTSDNDPENGALFVNPDYSLSAEELYQIVGEKIIAQSESLELLSSVQHESGVLELDHLDDLSYPSWIPQWNFVYTSTLLPWDQDDRFDAAKGFPLQKEKSDFPSRLVVKGIKIAPIIKGVSPGIYSSNGSLDFRLIEHPQFKDYFRTETGLLLLSKTLTARKTWYGSIDEDNSGRLADFCAFLVSDFGGIQHSSSYSTGSSPLSNKGKESSSTSIALKWLCDKAQNGDVDRYLEAAKTVCNNRKLFLTSDKRLGLGPSNIEPGDVLCVLSGGDLPFVLRPKGESYILVGECYVEGLMMGEAVEASGLKSLISRGFAKRILNTKLFEII